MRIHTDQNHINEKQKISKGFISGGLAGMISKFFIAPVDRIKYLFVTTERPFTYKNFLKEGIYIVKKHGIVNLWRGNMMNMAKVIPYAAIDFGVFDLLRYKFYINDESITSKVILFWCGAIAGITATTATSPIQMVRLRLGMEKQNFHYKGTTEAFKKILQRQGIRGFYRGFYASIIGVTLYHGSYFFIFTSAKEYFKKYKSEYSSKWYIDFLIGGLSAAGQVLAYPFDVLRKKMQGQRLRLDKGQIDTQMNYSQLVKSIIKNQRGLHGFYKGATLSLIKSPLGLAVVWTLKNNINRYLDANYDL